MEDRRRSGSARSDVTAGRRPETDTRRRRAVDTREPEVTSSSSSSTQSRRGSERDDNNKIVDKTIVVLQNTDYDNEMTPAGRGYDDDEDWKLVNQEVHRPVIVSTVQLHNDSAFNDSSDVTNATLNMTSFPPPPDRKYVDTLFKIAHIFHVVGIGILAFFVLQVTDSLYVKITKTVLYRRTVRRCLIRQETCNNYVMRSTTAIHRFLIQNKCANVK